jgi:hypothetical protein
MNTSIKNKHFYKWLNRKIGSKAKFTRRFGWTSTELNRWCRGENYPKAVILAQLMFDIHLYTGQEYTSLLCECNEALMKDFKHYMIDKRNNDFKY